MFVFENRRSPVYCILLKEDTIQRRPSFAKTNMTYATHTPHHKFRFKDRDRDRVWVWVWIWLRVRVRVWVWVRVRVGDWPVASPTFVCAHFFL
jgi:hypothetical protein